jgi:hypothetical protein
VHGYCASFLTGTYYPTQSDYLYLCNVAAFDIECRATFACLKSYDRASHNGRRLFAIGRYHVIIGEIT